VTALYQGHALSLARLALLMLGDPGAAEDVVQDAFLGLYRRWDSLANPSAAPAYLRTSVLNGCRTAMRRRSRPEVPPDGRPAESAEAAALLGEQHRAVLAAIRRLPARQREASPGKKFTAREQPGAPGGILGDVDTDTRGRPPGAVDARLGVTELYQAHGVGLIKLAVIMLGDRTAAEDVVQDAFFGLYRNWDRLSDPGKALAYVRASVLNGCRAALRQRIRRDRRDRAAAPDAPAAFESAESVVLLGEEHREVLAAVRSLPDRQREALVLRFYLGVSEDETARAMGISRGTVKSSTSRALAALGRMLTEES